MDKTFNAGFNSGPNDKYPELLSHLAALLQEIMLRQGLPKERAEQCSFQISEEIRNSWGGEIVYIPKGKDFELSQRNLQIWNDFNGTNVHELGRKYDMTMVEVYRVLRRMRAEQQRLRQKDMFGAEGTGT